MNEFEYKVLAPGNKAVDYQDFANWEKSLEVLRKKRVERQKIKAFSSQHRGTVRIMKIYQRGVYRHPGSIQLWMDYLDYAASIKATRRWRKIMTQALRMRPTDPKLWILAGRQSMAHGDMLAARTFFMRGCRFCSQDAAVWLEYARCEMQWLRRMDPQKPGAKARSSITAEQVADDDAIMFGDGEDEDDEEEEEIVLIPEPPTAQKLFTKEEDETLAKKNPAMDGAIPRAIFDIATKQPFFDAAAGEQFFDMFGEFSAMNVGSELTQHTLDSMMERYPGHPATCACHIRQPVVGVDVHTADFPRGLREVLARLDSSLETTTDKAELKRKVVVWMQSFLEVPDQDEAIQKVLEHFISSLQS